MDLQAVERIVNTVLYEGYLLYPYRPSAAKNRQRWNFGTLVPPAYAPVQGDPVETVTECLVSGQPDAELQVQVRFLQPQLRELYAGSAELRPVHSLAVGDRSFYAAQEAIEREILVPAIQLDALAGGAREQQFEFTPCCRLETLRAKNGDVAGRILRKSRDLTGRVVVSAEALRENLLKLRVTVCNLTAMQDPEALSREEALMWSMASTHVILSISGGAEFVSLLDPPAAFADAVARCSNQRTWPVLVGRKGERDCMLSSPIILYDYPEIAPESAGNLYDSSEIDELLTLRLLTLTDAEKCEVRAADERGRAVLDRAETLSSGQLLNLHGTLRGPENNGASVLVGGIDMTAGGRVRLKPLAGGDIFDIALDGRTAVIESIERDYEGRILVAVIIDDDPGKDFGTLRQPGHRFFFSPAELEPIAVQHG